tara:strand:- start:29 stop:1153 length:1125 start_codon:yes stop_codon:yes gene_type:complete
MTTKFCVHSHTGISIVNSGGSVRPCCKFDDIDILPTIFEIDTLDQIHRQSPFDDLKSNLNQGNFPKGCATCSNSEANGLESRRQFTGTMYGNYNLFNPNYIQDLEISLDYTCNMMCRMCNPGASSKWGSASTVIEQFADSKIELDDVTNYKDYQTQFKHVFENTDLSHARHVKLEGGEPFYAKNFEWMLDKLDREVIDKNKLFLNITTNGSVFPNENILSKLSKFNTTISFSIDAYGDLANCLRWGVEWDQIETNIRKFIKTDFNILTNITVSILNFNKLNQLIEFCDSIALRTSFNELHDPRYLSMYQLDKQYRMNYLSGVPKLDRLISADIKIEPEFKKLRRSIEILDDYQGLRFADVNEEIWSLINADFRQ